jgi:hypothetical protein
MSRFAAVVDNRKVRPTMNELQPKTRRLTLPSVRPGGPRDAARDEKGH